MFGGTPESHDFLLIPRYKVPNYMYFASLALILTIINREGVVNIYYIS
jgi:hypothetical protein